MFNVVLYYWLRNFSNLIGCIKRAVFQPNLKYLHAKKLQLPWQRKERLCLVVETMADSFPEFDDSEIHQSGL